MVGEQIIVTKEMTFNDMLKESKKGNALAFPTNPDEFVKLSREQLDQLTKRNILNYMTSMEACKDEAKNEGEPPLPAFSINPQEVQASDQLAVFKRDPKMHYAWIRPELVRKMALQGYKISDANKLDSFNQRKGVGIVGTMDNTELVLMETPKENYLRIEKRAHEESERRNGAVEDSTIEKLNQTGVTGVKVKGD